MTATTVMYFFWAATAVVTATTIIRALVIEHPLSGVAGRLSRH